jgi:hypothetical protein
LHIIGLKGESINTPGVSLGAAIIVTKASSEVHLAQNDRIAAIKGLEMTGKAEQYTGIHSRVSLG